MINLKKNNSIIDIFNTAKNIKEKDPAAKNIFEVLLLYQGI